MHDPPTPEKILQTGMAFWASKTLLSAVEIGVFTELAHGPARLGPLSQRIGLHSRSARDFLDALVALGFLKREDGCYHNTPETDLFLDRNELSYVGGILEMANHRLYPFWGQLTEALRTGQPQSECKTGGKSLFETLYADPGCLEEFLSAMAGVSHASNSMIARVFPWKELSNVCRYRHGTGRSRCANRTRQSAPARPGFDLPEVAPVFQQYAETLGIADRLTFVSGDFFKHDLPKADVALMGHILHDWDLPTKKMLIRKAFEAIPAGGALIVYETIIDDDRSQNAFGLLMSLNMLIETPAGFDYTGADCKAWMKDAGFSAMQVQQLAGPDSMVIGIK
jgi:hypothetical protein